MSAAEVVNRLCGDEVGLDDTSGMCHVHVCTELPNHPGPHKDAWTWWERSSPVDVLGDVGLRERVHSLISTLRGKDATQSKIIAEAKEALTFILGE